MKKCHYEKYGKQRKWYESIEAWYTEKYNFVILNNTSLNIPTKYPKMKNFKHMWNENGKELDYELFCKQILINFPLTSNLFTSQASFDIMSLKTAKPCMQVMIG